MTVFSAITTLLDQHKIRYNVLHHTPTPTSADSAAARGEPLRIGAKALVLKTDDQFCLFVLPADKKLDTKKIKAIVSCKSLRFATTEELIAQTTLPPGAIPPFGSLLKLPMYVDQMLFEEEFMAFNAGSLEISIKMKTADYKTLLQPHIASFAL